MSPTSRSSSSRRCSSVAVPSCRARASVSRSSSSTWARSTASGVRSSCEASETKSRWRANARSNRASMRSKVVASAPTSPRSATEPARCDRSPASTAAATVAIRRSGRAISVAIRIPAATASSSASDPATAKVRRRLAVRVLDRRQRIGDVQRPDPPPLVADRIGDDAHLAGLFDRHGGRPLGRIHEPVRQLLLLAGALLAFLLFELALEDVRVVGHRPAAVHVDQEDP